MPSPDTYPGHKNPRIIPVSGGHMNYERLLVSDGEELVFAKIHDASRFTDPIRERHSREYLAKEHAMMSHLREQGYSSLPSHSQFVDDHTLVMEGLAPHDGWQWRAPAISTDRYIADILTSISQLGRLPHPTSFIDSHGPSYQLIASESWVDLDEHKQKNIKTHLLSSLDRLSPRFRREALQLHDTLPQLQAQQFAHKLDTTYFCHHDLRQANVAWHPDHGVRIVDWSWAGTGPARSDSTSFLIDLHKSGHVVDAFMPDYFDAQHAHVLMGFLLGRSIAPTPGNDNDVRFHQLVSAVSAYSLLQRSALL